jgi:hypothetical protein
MCLEVWKFVKAGRMLGFWAYDWLFLSLTRDGGKSLSSSPNWDKLAGKYVKNAILFLFRSSMSK